MGAFQKWALGITDPHRGGLQDSCSRLCVWHQLTPFHAPPCIALHTAAFGDECTGGHNWTRGSPVERDSMPVLLTGSAASRGGVSYAAQMRFQPTVYIVSKAVLPYFSVLVLALCPCYSLPGGCWILWTTQRMLKTAKLPCLDRQCVLTLHNHKQAPS